MRLTSRKHFLEPVLACASLVAAPVAMAQPARNTAPLIVQEQGSFAVGGSVATAPGTFDPRKPLEPRSRLSSCS
ncbi:hypothetical protein CLG96_05740 [Sphingomonas oleivorans]|uniref:Uncharacterized protein n=1 Tax=Sphingomonas oleivorans TaxID=1735121 RepID=A0A2T5FZE2_9SPHN|nr:hypothetical protein [Sphingomonas oleivorans]PTQ12074.1 hypothetical protein CLG96_05740 [Sphingomonas oleivorans]